MTHAQVYLETARAANALASTAFISRQPEIATTLIDFSFSCLRKAVELADNQTPPTF